VRLLAIRGANLASLADEFEVDLAAEPLASAGLFAITGATGAGKSTLLDAVCAALFNVTPRLEGRSRFEVGRDGGAAVGAADVRSLLRRGAGAGWAEVDFEGRDHRRYRARWSVRRAHGKPTGAFQGQETSLVRLDDGARLGGTRRETQRAIEDALGLTFDQFRRSALLAQGDFAAFLRAAPGERSALLERMTGTSLYGELSMAAHRRGQAIASQRRGLAAAGELTPVLADDARAALIAALADAEAVVATRVDDEQQLLAAGRWREAAARWRADRAAADAAQVAADAARAALAAVAARLALIDRLAPVRGPWADATAAAGRVGELAATARTAAAAAAEAAGVAQARELAAVDAIAAARAARDAELAAVDAIAAARAADAAVAAAARRVDDAATVARDAAARQQAHAARQRALIDAMASAARDRDGAAAAMASAPLAAEVGERWPALDAALATLIERGAELAAARARLDEIAPALHDAEAELAAADAERGAGEQALAQTRARQVAAEAALAEAPVAPAQARAAASARRAAWVSELAALAARARQLAAAEHAAATAAAAARAQVATHAATDAALRDRAQGARAAWAEADLAAQRLRHARGLDAERGALVDGEACPLCGATEHPWRGDAVIDGLVAAQEARVAELAAALAALDAELAAQQLAAAVARGRAEASDDEAARLAGQRADLARAWRAELQAAGELPLAAVPESAAAAGWLDELAAAAAQERAAADAARTHAEALAAAAATAHAAVLTALHACGVARDRGDRARQAIADLVAARVAAERARDLAGQECGAARAVLAELAPGAVGVAPAALRATLAEAMPRWRRAADRHAAAERALAEHGATHAAGVALGVELAEAATAAQARATAAQAEHAAAARTRAGLLDGVATDVRVAALTAAVTATEAEAAAAQTASRAAALTAASAAAHAAAAHAADQAARADQARADRALAATLAAVDVPAAAAAIALAVDAAAVARDREQLAAATHAAVAAAARVAELERQRAALDQARPTLPALDADPPTWAARVAAAATATTAAREAVAALQAQLRADDAARAHRAAAAAALVAFDRDHLADEQLAALIGSADGKRLRDFAQSLTLETLLAAANAHLDELAPRYQLERVPGEDLELQVIDRDMGEEVRSLASLSGGETFLASLALALGLSSLSTGGTTVRTLLVDEGFGTLDPITLDTALAALDTLRASGRQVGIVSHVPGLDERVGATVEVRPIGGGKSVVAVHGPRA
jgi:exonuclease SbcC